MARTHVISDRMQMAAVPAYMLVDYVLGVPGHNWTLVNQVGALLLSMTCHAALVRA